MARQEIIRSVISKGGKSGVQVFAQGSGGGVAIAQAGQKVGTVDMSPYGPLKEGEERKKGVVIDTGGLFKSGASKSVVKPSSGAKYNDANLFMSKTGKVMEFDSMDNISIQASKRGVMGGSSIINIYVEGSLAVQDNFIEMVSNAIMGKVRNQIAT